MTCVACKQEFTYLRDAWVTKVYYHPNLDEKLLGGMCYTCCVASQYCGKCIVECPKGYYHYYPRKVMGKNKFMDDGNVYCPAHQNFNPAEKAILGYSSKADTYIGFIGSPADHFHMGVELEVESKNAKVVKDIIWDLFDNFIIMKTDGSLTGNGIEIVSAPAPFEVHMTAWNKFLDNVPDGLRSFVHANGAPTNCGMHIHVSRKALTALDIGKCAFFINDRRNSHFITALCGRYGNRYCQITPVLNTLNLSDYTSTSKYCAVNTYHTNTIEFRMFKGELNKIMFLKNIEFIHALCKFTKNRPVSEITESNFISYVVDKKVIYTNLHKFLVQYDFTPGTKEPQNLFKSI